MSAFKVALFILRALMHVLALEQLGKSTQNKPWKELTGRNDM